MAVTCAVEGRALRLYISGEVDHHGAREILRELDRQIDQALPLRLTVDLSGVSFMDSSGIAVLLRAYRRMGELGGSMVVTGIPPQPEKVLRAAGLDKILEFQ